MKRLIAALLFFPTLAWGVCPTTPSNCPSPTYNAVTVGPGILAASGVTNLLGGGSLGGTFSQELMVRWFLLILLVFRPAAAQTWGIDFYVAPTGSDTLDCATPGEACATLHVAAARAALAGPQPGGIQWIHVAAGAYNEGANFWANTNQVNVDGSGASLTLLNNVPGSCGTVIANKGAQVRLSNLKASAVADPTCGNTIYAQVQGVIHIGPGVTLGLATKSQLYCESSGSQIHVWSMIDVVGGGARNFAAMRDCEITFDPVPGVGVNFHATQSYPDGVISVMLGGKFYAGSTIIWPGAPVSGPSYSATTYGVVWTDGNGCASLPGSLPGTHDATGLCQ